MISVFQRAIFFKSMSQNRVTKRITAFIPKPISSKRKFSDVENKPHEATKKLAAEKITSIKFPHQISNETPSGHKVHTFIEFKVGKTWLDALAKEFKSDYFNKLTFLLLKDEIPKHHIYPPVTTIFSWTTEVAITDVKVVILGQDPYIRAGQAHGLAFSVPKGVDIPKSLTNIYQELATDVPGFTPPNHGCLNGWAKQGVLLLNSCLTVRAGQSNSHKNLGWEPFTNAVIKWISENRKNVVFMLWGNNAKEKVKLICCDKHLVLTAAHPSPLSASRGFFGCKHFSTANWYLQRNGIQGIDWSYLP